MPGRPLSRRGELTTPLLVQLPARRPQAEGVDGDIGRAFEWLRKRGIAKASAMADRSANEGAVYEAMLSVESFLGVLMSHPIGFAYLAWDEEGGVRSVDGHE